MDQVLCTRADVTAELPIGGIITPGGVIASANATSDTLEYDGHGFETDTPVTVRVVDATDATLPSPLVDGTTYYAIRISNSRFKLSLTAGGAAIDLTTDGREIVVTREPDFDRAIAFYSSWAYGLLPAHAVPLEEPIDPLVVGVVARCAAAHVMNINGQHSELVEKAEIAGRAILERYAKGLPLRAQPGARTNKSVVPRTSSSTDPRGWGCGGVG